MVVTKKIQVSTNGNNEVLDITPQAVKAVAESGVSAGTVTLFVIGSTVVSSNTTTKAFDSFTESIGAVAAIYGCVTVLVSFLTSLIMVALHENNQLGLSLVLTLISLISGFLFIYLLTKTDEVALYS